MTFPDFLNNSALQTAADAFVAAFGGDFVGDEPGDALLYLPPDDDAAGRLPPEEETADTLLQLLKESVKQHRNLIVERWPEQALDPEADY